MIIDNVKFPCILKPSHQTVGKYNEFKFKICKNFKQLKRTLAFVRRDSEFLLQQYIPKEKDILVYGARMLNGDMCIAGALIRDRFCGTGESSHGLITPKIPSCVDIKLIKYFLEKTGYYGLFSVEYGMLHDKAYFFEVNFRNDGTSHFFFQAGANIPLAWAYSSLGLEYSNVPTVVSGDHYYMDEIYDIQNVKEGKMSIEQWEKERAEATIFKYYSSDDTMPYEVMQRIKNKKLLFGRIVSKYRIYIVWFLDKLGIRRD
jgi:predicted ATP-grasp superfamily ATP-dependent carboligase